MTPYPNMTYNTLFRYIYTGPNKISAIKAVRAFLGLDLRSAKDLVEWRGGFMCPQGLMDKIKTEYESNVLYGDRSHWKLLEELPPPIKLF